MSHTEHDDANTILCWAMKVTYELGLEHGRINAALNGTPQFKAAWQCAADFGLTKDTALRGAFTSGFLEALRNAGQF